MNPSSLPLYGVLRLSIADSIGVPIFMSGNSMYVPEMDADFNIMAFLDFVNEDDYTIAHDIPESYRTRAFQIGDPAPIVFWINQVSHLVEGDAEKSKLTEIFGPKARAHPVLVDLGEMLHDARTGKIRQQQEEWLAGEIETAFDDVFLEAPSRTRYWISRYRAALENARKLTKPPHPIDVRLRRASSEWLENFATKAELPMMAAILGEASQGVYSLRQIADIMFAYISHRLTSTNSAEIARLANDPTIKALFRDGLYFRYLQDDWPHVSFSYNKPDFIVMMNERLVRGKERGAWATARSLSRLLFGEKEAPREVDDLAFVYLREALDAYKKATDRSNFYRDDVGLYGGEEAVRMAQYVLRRFEQINDLSCIMHGEDRVRGRIKEGRFQIWPDDLEQYKSFISRSQNTDPN